MLYESARKPGHRSQSRDAVGAQQPRRGDVLRFGDRGTGGNSGPEALRAPDELKRTFRFALRETDRTLPHHYLYTSREDFTGIGEAVAAYELGRLFQTLHRANRVTQSRFLNWGQVQKQDLVLLGGPSSNDWSYQDDARSNFQFVRGGIANGKPLPGELKFYSNEPGTAPLTARVEYGLLKMLTSPYGFKTLLLAGVSAPVLPASPSSSRRPAR